MAPTLAPGDYAIAIPLRHPEVGEVVVVEHPDRPGYEMVKRIAGAPGQRVGERTLEADEWWVEGDYPDASRTAGRSAPCVETR